MTFKDNDDILVRGSVFKTIEEHDDELVDRHNSVVDNCDRVYLLGDVCISRRARDTIGRLRGRLVLVKGNHDIFKLSDYLPYFDDIRSCVVQKDSDGNKVILTHVPIHPDSLSRFGRNIHGHYHQNSVKLENGDLDPRYICVSLEHTNYYPIEIYKALKKGN